MSKTFCHCGGEIINGHHCSNGHLMLRNEGHTAIPIMEEDKPELTREQFLIIVDAFEALKENEERGTQRYTAILEARAIVMDQFSRRLR